MEKIHLNELTILELIQLESACRILYSKEENEYLAFRGQLSPNGMCMYKDSLEEMEKRVRKYSDIRGKLLTEIGLRLENIEFDKTTNVTEETEDIELEETNNEEGKES